MIFIIFKLVSSTKFSVFYFEIVLRLWTHLLGLRLKVDLRPSSIIKFTQTRSFYVPCPSFSIPYYYFQAVVTIPVSWSYDADSRFFVCLFLTLHPLPSLFGAGTHFARLIRSLKSNLSITMICNRMYSKRWARSLDHKRSPKYGLFFVK